MMLALAAAYQPPVVTPRGHAAARLGATPDDVDESAVEARSRHGSVAAAASAVRTAGALARGFLDGRDAARTAAATAFAAEAARMAEAERDAEPAPSERPVARALAQLAPAGAVQSGEAIAAEEPPVEAAARRQAVVVDRAGHDFHDRRLVVVVLLRAPRQAPAQSLQEASSLLARLR